MKKKTFIIITVALFLLAGTVTALGTFGVIEVPKEIDLSKASPAELKVVEDQYNADRNKQYIHEMFREISGNCMRIQADGNVQGAEQILNLTRELLS